MKGKTRSSVGHHSFICHMLMGIPRAVVIDTQRSEKMTRSTADMHETRRDVRCEIHAVRIREAGHIRAEVDILYVPCMSEF